MDFRFFASLRLSLWARWAAVTLAGLLLAGCAGVGGGVAPQTDAEAKQKAVAVRAEARMALLIGGDIDAAYDFLSEGSKATISKDAFRRRMSLVPFRAYRIEAVRCEGESCKVEAKWTYDHRLMRGVTTPVTETWVIERGQAYYVFPAG